MPKIADGVAEITTTTGTGTLTLAGAKTGFRAFSAGFVDGDEVYYSVRGGSEWESGIGVYSAGTLARGTILASSNAGALVNLSAGAKDVFCGASSDLLAPLGPYSDTTALQIAKPAAKYPGRVALVGAAAPFSPYISTGAAWVESLAGSGGGSGATVRAFTAAVPFDLDYSYFSAQVTGPIAFSLNAAGAVAGGWALYEMVADGVNTPTFAGIFTKQSSSGSYNNTLNKVNLIAFFKGQYGYTYTISQGGTAALADSTAPTVTGRVATSKNAISITFSEPVLASGVTGWTFSRGTGLTATAVSGSGTSTLVFTISQDMLNTDTITVAYEPGTVTDAATNPLASFSAIAVTNSIPAADTTAPTLVSASVEGSTSVVALFSEPVLASTAGWSFNNGSALGVSAISGSGTNTLTFTVSGGTIAAGETVTVSYSGGTTADASGNPLATISAASVINNTALTFTSRSFVNNTGTTFTKGATGTAYGGMAFDSKVLPASTPGRVWAKNLSTSGVPDCFIGFNTSAAASSLAGAAYACVWQAGATTLGASVSGSYSGRTNVGSWAANDLAGVVRKADGAIWVQKSSDNGLTWVDVYNTGLTNTGALYPVCFIQGAMYEPAGSGLV